MKKIEPITAPDENSVHFNLYGRDLATIINQLIENQNELIEERKRGIKRDIDFLNNEAENLINKAK